MVIYLPCINEPTKNTNIYSNLKVGPDGNFLLLARRILSSCAFCCVPKKCGYIYEITSPNNCACWIFQTAAFSKDSMCISALEQTQVHICIDINITVRHLNIYQEYHTWVAQYIILIHQTTNIWP